MMKIDISYVLHAILISGLFYGSFILFFRKSTNFQANRLFLLMSMLVPIFLPLVQVTWPVSNEFIQAYGVMLPVQAIEKTTNGVAMDYTRIFRMIYWIISAFLLLAFFTKLYKINKLIRVNGKEVLTDYIQVSTKNSQSVFSFFNFLFLPKTHQTISDEIILHELAHIRQNHSLDIILTEIVKVFFWINPFFWIITRLIRTNHEYLADNYVLMKSKDNQSYINLLVGDVVGKQLGLAHNFNNSIILKRIQMIKKNKNPKTSALRYWLIIPILLIAFFQFSFKLAGDKEVNNELVSVERYTKPAQILSQSEDTVKPPVFPNMLEFISTNIKYPEKAVKKGISGVVYIKVSILKNGDLSKAVILRGIESSLNNEALRVVKLMKKWTPGEKNGKKVNMDITIPIKFNLDGKP